MRPPDSRPQIDAIITIEPPPRRRICGTAMREARTAGNRVWSNASCHSASVVWTMSDPLARPTLLTRISRPPKVSTVLITTSATPFSVDRSACTARTRSAPPGIVRRCSTAEAIPSSPRAQIVTREPSWTSAVAMASPNPRVEPVTMAIFSASPRSMSAGCSASAAAGQVVERPVERGVDQLEAVLLEECLLGRQELRQHVRDDRAFDGAAAGEGGRCLVGVGRRELLLAPREDRADVDLGGLPVDADALGARDALGGGLRELLLETRRRKGFAAQPAAAGGAAAEREEDARIVEAGEDRLLDLIEGDRAAGDAVRQPLERAGNLPDALRRIGARPSGNRIVIDDGFQHEGVVRVEPERDLLLARHLVDRSRALLGDEAVELAPFGFEGAIVRIPVPDVEIEQLIEGLLARAVGQRFLCGRRHDRQGGQQSGGKQHTHVFDYNRWLRNRARAALKSSGCSRFVKWPAPGITVSSAPAMPARISSESAGGVSESWSPTTMRVGTWIVDSSGVESGRVIIALTAPAIDSGEFDSTSDRTRSATSGRAVRVVSPSSLGIISSATAPGPFPSTSASIFLRPSRP